MKIRGQINFLDNGEYGVYTGDQFVNLSQALSKRLEQEHRVTIDTKEKNLFDKTGIVKLDNDLGGNVYRYWIGKHCLDDILFDLSDTNKSVTIKF